MKIRILIADDHKILREGLRTLLQPQPDMEVVGEAEDGRQAVEMAQRLAPHVVIMDVSMPNLNGIEAARQILQGGGGVRVIALSMYSDKRFIIEMFKAGASGYLLKDCAFEEVADAVRAVSARRVYISPKIAGTVIEDYVAKLSDEGRAVAGPLTGREREIVQLIAEGKSTKEIALCLKVSVKTVESHRNHIMEKLNIRSVPELTKYAIREGITSLN